MGVDDFIAKPFEMEELLTRIENLLENSRARMSVKVEGNPQENDDFIGVTMKIVRENLSNSEFTAQALAKELNYSIRHLERLLKQKSGLSPNAFIREVRLQHAFDMIQSRQKNTIAEVAYLVGFEQPSYFSRRFKERFGIRPTDMMG